MIRDRNGDGVPITTVLHNNMTAALPHLNEPVCGQKITNLTATKNAESTQPPPLLA